MSLDGLIADLIATTTGMVVRIREFALGEPIPDDPAPLGTKVKDLTGDRDGADALNLAVTEGSEAQSEGPGAPHQLARPDAYDECVALNEAHERHISEAQHRSLDCYQYGAMMARLEAEQRPRFAITLRDDELMGRD